MQVQRWIEELSVDIFKRQSSFAPVLDDAEYSFGCSHLALLSVLCIKCFLFPFALWLAFPTSVAVRYNQQYDSCASIFPRLL